MRHDFWNISSASNSATVDVFGVIGNIESDIESTSAENFVRDLRKLGRPKRLDIHVHSPGGSVWDGMLMYRALRDFPAAEKVVHVDAVAASIASVVMLAGDTIRVAPEAVVMVHDPMAFTMGNEADFEHTIGRLKQAKTQILQIYEKRTGGIVSQLSKWMSNETWFHGQEIIDAGFADELVADLPRGRVAAYSPELLKRYKNVPTCLSRKPAPVSAAVRERLKKHGIV